MLQHKMYAEGDYTTVICRFIVLLGQGKLTRRVLIKPVHRHLRNPSGALTKPNYLNLTYGFSYSNLIEWLF